VRQTLASHCLRFIRLTTRSGEGRGASWGDVDLTQGVLKTTADRMKARRPHRPPLSGAALALLKTLDPGPSRGTAFISLSPSGSGLLSEAALRKLMAITCASEFTLHGFRCGLRDWAGNGTGFPAISRKTHSPTGMGGFRYEGLGGSACPSEGKGQRLESSWARHEIEDLAVTF